MSNGVQVKTILIKQMLNSTHCQSVLSIPHGSMQKGKCSASKKKKRVLAMFTWGTVPIHIELHNYCAIKKVKV